MAHDKRIRGRLRESILDAAHHLLFDTGDEHAVSIDAVVAAVGCTPPALYYYFPSKEHLLLAVCRRAYERFAEELEQSIPPGGDPIDELRARGRAYLDWAIAHPEHYRILFMTSHALPDDIELDPRESAGLRELIGNIERAVEGGQLAAGDSLSMAFMLWSAVHGVASLAAVNPEIPSAITHAVLDFNSQAILAALTAG